MEPHEFWQKIETATSFDAAQSHFGFYPAAFEDGRRLLLPIHPLADGEHALASLILNQASFEVVDAIAAARGETVGLSTRNRRRPADARFDARERGRAEVATAVSCRS